MDASADCVGIRCHQTSTTCIVRGRRQRRVLSCPTSPEKTFPWKPSMPRRIVRLATDAWIRYRNKKMICRRNGNCFPRQKKKSAVFWLREDDFLQKANGVVHWVQLPPVAQIKQCFLVSSAIEKTLFAPTSPRTYHFAGARKLIDVYGKIHTQRLITLYEYYCLSFWAVAFHWSKVTWKVWTNRYVC